MDYLKEFQALAGRFSAAAEDKLASVDGGTYKEFIRFYSQRWPTEVSVIGVLYFSPVVCCKLFLLACLNVCV